ncbi:hypothetical protein [Paraburkholderia sp. J10-1]|uniref:hypothetical protein n=1 Tax=Paraburkholderia sp. J10-1 TaxID=2805430 RepID=UPI002AB72CC3|nr:hypothetical protein [Paraburkholderia sp. J10-1]
MSKVDPCPFCGAGLTPADAPGYLEHPPAVCILGGFEVPLDELAKWNRRDVADPHGVTVLLGSKMYVDNSMHYRNGTSVLTIKRLPRQLASEARQG